MGKRKTVALPEDLCKKMIKAMTSRDVLQKTLFYAASAGTDLSTKEGQAFVDRATDATARYNALYAEAMAVADKAGYDVATCEGLKVDFYHGVVFWDTADAGACDG